MADENSQTKTSKTIGEKILAIVGFLIPWLIFIILLWMFPAFQTTNIFFWGGIVCSGLSMALAENLLE